MTHPRIIQGGMGIAISNWRLAKAVSCKGQLGVVSGTGIWLVISRILQEGDIGGHVRRALDHFPIPEAAGRVLNRYFIAGGKASDKPFRGAPMLSLPLLPDLSDLIVAANFVEVWLAKEGHDGLVGVNYLEKIQLSLLPSLYGAMLAGVDYVLMGAGIPVQVPEALDKLAGHLPATYRLYVEGATADDVFEAGFNPADLALPEPRQPLKRPNFFPIISSHVLAQMLVERSHGSIEGFVIEGPTAGGHNAPPRNRKELTPTGEPLYGERDVPNLEKIKALGLPFWLAGSCAGPGALDRAIALGAHGIQAGSIFALCEESGLRQDLKTAAVKSIREGELEVFTSPRCSPSGFPFKEAIIPGTLTDAVVYEAREPCCDIGALRTLYRQSDGTLGYRCPAEPLELFLKKGGAAEDAEGRCCLCNTLMSTAGYAQVRTDGYIEPPLVTLGTDLAFLQDLPDGYTAADAVSYLLTPV